ncbi:unnamed protein product [Schistocephalus solidus]|uniref:Uncharacterized protein n=1 Tax=Schistocephalus solidus TaxID=70667 RepID=A0A3P7DIN1_SCHSO|nr:unnamed protein product [Schistocephalus solidus]
MMIQAGSDDFATLISELYSQQGRISMMTHDLYCPLFVLTLVSTMSSSSLTSTGGNKQYL